jgi:hypothetical protein
MEYDINAMQIVQLYYDDLGAKAKQLRRKY